MTNGIDNRRSFRIIESVILQYEIIDDAVFSKGIDRWKIRAGQHTGLRSRALDFDARLHELLYRMRLDAPAACDAIELLNEKLNALLEALPEIRESKEGLANQPARNCELSAEGMVFGVNETLPPQTKLMLRFLMVSDSRFFETFCRVVRVIGEDDLDDHKYDHHIAVEFTGMNPTERETLIQHLFSKQSETLRLRRIQLEDSA